MYYKILKVDTIAESQIPIISEAKSCYYNQKETSETINHQVK